MTTPSARDADPLTAARLLRVTLAELSDSLAGGRLGAVLDVESRLATATAALMRATQRQAGVPVTPAYARELGAELEALRAAVSRCTALGASLDDLVRARCSTGYRASGGGVSVPVRPSIEGQA